MSRHSTECYCAWCTQTEKVRRIIGKLFGYPDCCVEAYETERAPTRKQKVMRKIVCDRLCDLELPGATNFIPCHKHVKQMFLRGKTEKKLAAMCNNIIQRPWPLTESIPNFESGKYQLHAYNALTDNEYAIWYKFMGGSGSSAFVEDEEPRGRDKTVKEITCVLNKWVVKKKFNSD